MSSRRAPAYGSDVAYTHFLAPFDGTPLARAALSLSAWLAWKGGGEVDLVRAVSDHPPLSIVPLAGMADAAEHLANAKNELSSEAARLRGQGVSATGVAFRGEPARVLLDYVARRGIDLVVMGTHGRPLAERWLLGSVASEMARRSPVPVVLVPREAKPVHDDPLRLMVALDGSVTAESALEAALGLASTVPCAITLFEVLPGAGPSPDEKTLDWYRQPALGAGDYLERMQQHLADRGIHVDAAYSAGEPGDEIELFAERGPFDAIAMGTRGLTGLPRLLWGSVAERVVRHAHVPVLLTSGSTVSESHTLEPARMGRKGVEAAHMRYLG
jgi:nucleotide-binding universal stress UspA family protein